MVIGNEGLTYNFDSVTSSGVERGNGRSGGHLGSYLDYARYDKRVARYDRRVRQPHYF